MSEIIQIICSLIALLPTIVLSECCHTREILFKTNNINKYCNEFGGFDTTLPRLTQGRACVANVCGNGKLEPGKMYCGLGLCNIFGCNCDNGCIRGDFTNEFKGIYGDQIDIIK